MAPPEGTTLVVDPNVYYKAAEHLATLAGGIGTAVTRDLVPGLAASSGMGGNYSAVTGWNSAYHKNSGEVRTAVLAVTAALAHFGDILNIAGYNWDTAEYNANTNPNKGSPPAHPVLGAATPLGAAGFPEIPDPSGDNGAGLTIAPAWGFETPWTGAPNGHADALAAAAAAWDAFAFSTELLTSPSAVLDVRISFTGVQAPEVPDIEEALKALEGAADQVSNVACALAAKTGLYHDHLVEVRQQLIAAAPGAFPAHPGANMIRTTNNTSVRISVAATLTTIDVLNALSTFNATVQHSTLLADFTKSDYALNGFTASDALSNIPKVQALAELPLLVESGNQNDNTSLHGELDNLATWRTPTATLTAVNVDALNPYGPQMKNWAMLAVKYGNEAGVDPRLVLAMALQEGAPLRSGLESKFYDQLQGGPSVYEPHSGVGKLAGIGWDEARLNASRLGVDKNGAGNSIGLTNQKEGPFNEVAAKYKDQFKGQEWSDLVGNDDLAMKAAAYNLKMLNDDAASQATVEVRASQPHDQFLGSGYNAGGLVGRSLDVALGNGGFQELEIEHGQSTVNVVALANTILCGSGAYR
ncbi:hypothetical protein OHB26_06160 [Nocardia sp. NBC_01503]|uniref:hypothetical protein n=1 Tax=Nocardia sp. NBC_01503 TaxID=2975997 RepID=UPI002E7BF635|nr:hypothetical protein [Nocardia sp. NBC_01503]WTL33802.1 hypothetical protein OHB26_06160 [Nocardia sp. NBC_01503]